MIDVPKDVWIVGQQYSYSSLSGDNITWIACVALLCITAVVVNYFRLVRKNTILNLEGPPGPPGPPGMTGVCRCDEDEDDGLPAMKWDPENTVVVPQAMSKAQLRNYVFNAENDRLAKAKEKEQS